MVLLYLTIEALQNGTKLRLNIEQINYAISLD